MIHGQAESNQSLRPTAGSSCLRPWPTPPEHARRITIGSLRRGFEWNDRFGQFCLLTDVAPVLTNSCRAIQTVMVFDQVEALLDRLGYTFSQVIRIWFSLEDIASWHDEFHRVRASFYSERGLLGRAPASTELGASSEQRVAVRAHVLACRLDTQVSATVIGTQACLHSQVSQYGTASTYAAALSRGVVLESRAAKRLYVSGTTSTDAQGQILHPNEVELQLKEIFRTVGAMLGLHGLGFNDSVFATAYVSEPADEQLVRTLWTQHLGPGIACEPGQFVRDDLRCALELVAERPT